MSDIHIGRECGGRDGAEWLARAYEDVGQNIGRIDYGLTLGDISHNGDRKSLQKYVSLRNQGSIPRWFELAGNHEFRDGGIANYRSIVGDTNPYVFVDGNLAWIFLPDESDSPSGDISESNLNWLTNNLSLYRNKVIILCTHQIPPNTVRRSRDSNFCLRPKRRISDILNNGPITLSLFGHEHHRPYSCQSSTRRHDTTFVNVASLNHAYGTKASGSVILELKHNSQKILVLRRNHDKKSFQRKFELSIPLKMPIQFD